MHSTKQKYLRKEKINQRLLANTRRSWLSYLLDFILPPVCVHCHKPVAEHGHLCASCWQKVHFIAAPLCDITGLPLPYEPAPFENAINAREQIQISALALSHPPQYDRARAAALFGDVVRTLIHGLKYQDRREGLTLFGRWLVLAGRDLLTDADLIIPVPLYRGRLWQRRFNQSALLSLELARLTGLPVNVLALKRHRATRSQVGLSDRQRRANVTGAFTLSPQKHDLVRGQNILLIDDVLTTGSTVDACSKVLKKAGARRVDVLVLARAGNLDGPDMIAN
jgi:ComF family protein